MRQLIGFLNMSVTWHKITNGSMVTQIFSIYLVCIITLFYMMVPPPSTISSSYKTTA